jgi:hypothetical protein
MLKKEPRRALKCQISEFSERYKKETRRALQCQFGEFGERYKKGYGVICAWNQISEFSERYKKGAAPGVTMSICRTCRTL